MLEVSLHSCTQTGLAERPMLHPLYPNRSKNRGSSRPLNPDPWGLKATGFFLGEPLGGYTVLVRKIGARQQVIEPLRA